MKPLLPLLLLFNIAACAGEKQKSYTGSTPAGNVVRDFLGISLSDSVDFIRWDLAFHDETYSLDCNYGIGKPNTNGFIDGGKTIKLEGPFKKESNYLKLVHENKALNFLEINGNLLHLLNNDKELLVGTGGWSYTLNNRDPVSTDAANTGKSSTVLKDSMTFHGRTPCGMLARSGCRRLKWSIVLYANPQTNQPGRYRARGTAMPDAGQTGDWKIMTGKNGRTLYQLNDANGNGFLYLLKLDDNNVIFTDAKGNLLVGDLDFSYTLSRKSF